MCWRIDTIPVPIFTENQLVLQLALDSKSSSVGTHAGVNFRTTLRQPTSCFDFLTVPDVSAADVFF